MSFILAVSIDQIIELHVRPLSGWDGRGPPARSPGELYELEDDGSGDTLWLLRQALDERTVLGVGTLLAATGPSTASAADGGC